jgi:hypothetical protein
MKPLLQIRNHHVPACGEAPAVNDDDPNVYLGYFAGPFGDHWVFTYDRTTKTAQLRGGDVEWDNVFILRDDGTVPELILGLEESLWLSACWEAATGLCAMPCRSRLSARHTNSVGKDELQDFSNKL